MLIFSKESIQNHLKNQVVVEEGFLLDCAQLQARSKVILGFKPR